MSAQTAPRRDWPMRRAATASVQAKPVPQHTPHARPDSENRIPAARPAIENKTSMTGRVSTAPERAHLTYQPLGRSGTNRRNSRQSYIQRRPKTRIQDGHRSGAPPTTPANIGAPSPAQDKDLPDAPSHSARQTGQRTAAQQAQKRPKESAAPRPVYGSLIESAPRRRAHAR